MANDTASLIHGLFNQTSNADWSNFFNAMDDDLVFTVMFSSPISGRIAG